MVGRLRHSKRVGGRAMKIVRTKADGTAQVHRKMTNRKQADDGTTIKHATCEIEARETIQRKPQALNKPTTLLGERVFILGEGWITVNQDTVNLTDGRTTKKGRETYVERSQSAETEYGTNRQILSFTMNADRRSMSMFHAWLKATFGEKMYSIRSFSILNVVAEIPNDARAYKAYFYKKLGMKLEQALKRAKCALEVYESLMLPVDYVPNPPLLVIRVGDISLLNSLSAQPFTIGTTLADTPLAGSASADHRIGDKLKHNKKDRMSKEILAENAAHSKGKIRKYTTGENTYLKGMTQTGVSGHRMEAQGGYRLNGISKKIVNK